MQGGWRRASVAIIVVIGVGLALRSLPAGAKGGYALTAATVQGAGWAEPRRIALRLPDGYDEMLEVLDAEFLAARDTPIERRSDAALGEQLPYQLTLEYEFTLSCYCIRSWSGYFDGDRKLFFPSAMVVGNGVWQAGWYEANPLVADALRRALREGQASVAGPPRTGAGPLDDGAVAVSTFFPVIALVFASAAWLIARRAHQGSGRCDA